VTETSLWGRPPEDDPDNDESADLGDRPDPRLRPPDPAGTQPKFDPKELLPPKRREPLLRPGVPPVGVDLRMTPPEPPRAPEPPVPGHRAVAAAPRFQFALGALIAVAIAGIVAAAAIVIGTPADPKGPAVVKNWSAWQPQRGAGDPATQIAEHVGREYRLPDGKQLVAVTGGAMQIASLPLYPALRNEVGDIKLIEGKGVLFRLCGLGEKCAIESGEASQERHLLLRREALELALYSFRYLNVDYAVVFLPPKKGEDPSQALYLPRKDVQGALNRPLSATLFHRTPNTKTVTASPDAAFVQTLTTRQLFTIKGFTQGNQDDKAYLVLEPLGG
jgi:hypothetical protein